MLVIQGVGTKGKQNGGSQEKSVILSLDLDAGYHGVAGAGDGIHFVEAHQNLHLFIIFAFRAGLNQKCFKRYVLKKYIHFIQVKAFYPGRVVFQHIA